MNQDPDIITERDLVNWLRPTPSTALPSAPRVNLGRWFLGLAVFSVAFAVYGSLLPFDFQEFNLELALRQFLTSVDHPPALTGGGRVDFCANVLVLIPFGFGVLGWRQASARRPWSAAAVAILTLTVAVFISVSYELAQSALPRRVPSLYDSGAQILGTVLGIIAWFLFGARIVRWCNSFHATRRQPERLELALKGYYLMLLLVSVLPLDLTVHPGDLLEKYRLGRISLIPFAEFTLSGPAVLELIFGVMYFIPVGMLALTLFKSREGSSRGVFEATLVGVALVAFIEMVQLFVFSRFTNVTDLIVGTGGVVIGAWIGRYMLSEKLRPRSHRSSVAAWWWLGLAAAYLVIPCCSLWWPFEFTGDSQAMSSKIDGLMQLPFQSLIVSSSPLTVMSLIVERTLMFIPFGLFLGNALQHVWTNERSGGFVMVIGVLATSAVAVALEAGQMFIPDRSPDITDPLLATAGGALGLLISQRLTVSQSVLVDRVATG